MKSFSAIRDIENSNFKNCPRDKDQLDSLLVFKKKKKL